MRTTLPATVSVDMTVNINPRRLFVPYLNRTQRHATLMISRRHGKTFACLQDLILKAITIDRPGPAPMFSYIGPTGDQAKAIAWPYLKEFLAPLGYCQWHEAELMVDIPRTTPGLPRSRIRLFSGNNYERMRGLYNDGVIVDEADDISPNAWAYVIRPTLSDYKGWATFCGTPKGKGVLYSRLHNDDDPDAHYKLVARADRCGILDAVELDEIRRDIGDAAYEQEYLLNCDVPVPGAIFASALNKARSAGRIKKGLSHGHGPYFTVWDIGAPLNTSVWTFQIVQDSVLLLHCDAGMDWDLLQRSCVMIGRKYPYAAHILPHDAGSRLPGGLSYREELERAGLTNLHIVPRTDNPVARIELTSRMFDRFWFDSDNCEYGLNALQAYRRRYNKHTRQYEDNAYHDWASHVADALCMISEAAQAGIIRLSVGGLPTPASRVITSAGYADSSYVRGPGRVLVPAGILD